MPITFKSQHAVMLEHFAQHAYPAYRIAMPREPRPEVRLRPRSGITRPRYAGERPGTPGRIVHTLARDGLMQVKASGSLAMFAAIRRVSNVLEIKYGALGFSASGS